VTNYAEVMSVLEAYGFESVVLEDMSLRAQIATVYDAKAILGPHGAGFVKMLFANDPFVAEFLPESRLRPEFYLLAGLLGFDYDCLVAPDGADRNMTVDTDALEELLDRNAI
jgi:hypothetical protein